MSVGLSERHSTVGDAAVPIDDGFVVHAMQDTARGVQHLAIVWGDVKVTGQVVVHVHRECVAGNVLTSSSCACRQRLQSSLADIRRADAGVLLYLRTAASCPLRIDPSEYRDTVDSMLTELGVVHAGPLFEGPRDAERSVGRSPAGLTDRELEVLRLIASGLLTKQIALRLAISQRTAYHHVEHIYTKIGASTRAAAAAFAVRNGIGPSSPDDSRWAVRIAGH